MKKPDMSSLSSIKEKLKIDKILNKIAEVVDGHQPLSDVDVSDALGKKIADLDKLVCDLLHVHKQHAEDLSQIHTLLNEVFEDVNQLREQSKSRDSGESTEAAENKAEVVEEPKEEVASEDASSSENTEQPQNEDKETDAVSSEKKE